MKTRDQQEIFEYVLLRGQNFLHSKKSIFERPFYSQSYLVKGYDGRYEFGRGTSDCLNELYIGEYVVEAFTAESKYWLDDDWCGAMICFTDQGRIIVADERIQNVHAEQLYRTDARKIKLGREEKVIGGRIFKETNKYDLLGIGDSFKFRDLSYTSNDNGLPKMANIIMKYINTYAEA